MITEVGRMDNNREDICIICNRKTDEGYYLYTSYICCVCEKDMLETEPHEEKYQYYINKLKATKPKTKMLS